MLSHGLRLSSSQSSRRREMLIWQRLWWSRCARSSNPKPVPGEALVLLSQPSMSLSLRGVFLRVAKHCVDCSNGPALFASSVLLWSSHWH